MEKRNKKRINGWKVSFLFLLFLNVVGFIFLFVNLTSSDIHLTVDENSQMQDVPSNETIRAEVTLHEKDLEQLLQTLWVSDENTQVPVIQINGDISFSGEWEFFGFQVPYYLKAEPFSLETGDLQLKVQTVQIGNLSMPVKSSLRLLAEPFTASLPIEVDVENEALEIHLTKVKTEQLWSIQLLRIDKENREYVLETTIPKQNLLQ